VWTTLQSSSVDRQPYEETSMRTLSVITVCATLAVPGFAWAASPAAAQATHPGSAVPIAAQPVSTEKPPGGTATEDKLREEACVREADAKHVAAANRHQFLATCMERKAKEAVTHAPKPGVARDVPKNGAVETPKK
jgi:hypothetical protein